LIKKAVCKEIKLYKSNSNLIKMTDALYYKSQHIELVEEIRKNFDDRTFTYYVQYASIDLILSMKPVNFVKKISPRPLLLMAGKEDEIVPCDRHAKILFEKAGGKKKLVIFDKDDHGLLAKPTTNDALGCILSWVKENLI